MVMVFCVSKLYKTNIQFDGCIGMTSPKFQQFLKSVIARIGKEAVFECQILGEPAPQITWLVSSQFGYVGFGLKNEQKFV